MVHHPQKLGSQQFDLPKGRHVLHGHDQRFHVARFGQDRRGVDQNVDGSACMAFHRHLFRPQDPVVGEGFRQREISQGVFPAVAPPDRQVLGQALRRIFGCFEDVRQSERLAVHQLRQSVLAIEHHHSDGRSVDQRFKIRLGPSLLFQAPRVGEHGCGLRREGGERLFVPAIENLARVAVGDVELSHVPSLMSERHGQNGRDSHRQPKIVESQRGRVRRQVVDAQGTLDPIQVLDHRGTAGRFTETVGLLGRHPRDHEINQSFGIVRMRDQRVVRASKLAGALQDSLQHLVQVEALVYPEHGGAQVRG